MDPWIHGSNMPGYSDFPAEMLKEDYTIQFIILKRLVRGWYASNHRSDRVKPLIGQPFLQSVNKLYFFYIKYCIFHL